MPLKTASAGPGTCDCELIVLQSKCFLAVILPSDMELRPSDTEELINRDDCASITDSIVNSQIPYSVSSVKLNRDNTNSSLNENKIDNVTAPIKKELKFEVTFCLFYLIGSYMYWWMRDFVRGPQPFLLDKFISKIA